MKEIRRRTRVVGSFPDGYSAMMVRVRRTHLMVTVRAKAVVCFEITDWLAIASGEGAVRGAWRG